jgi:GntR family transcriptional regulator, transcriptional repressor for pyruvate dehydrogenase complex
MSGSEQEQSTVAESPRAYEELAAEIREQIVAGELGGGEQVPSEAALAQSARVSRSTVREALRTLEVAGFIERVRPRLMVVARDLDEPANREARLELGRQGSTFNDLFESLRMLEPELTRLAADRADSADIASLRKALDAQAAALGDFAAWNQLDVEFHLMVAEMSGNPALILARTPIAQFALEAMSGFVDSEAKTAQATRFHRQMVDALADRDGELAALVTRRHVDDWREAWVAAGYRLDAEIRP